VREGDQELPLFHKNPTTNVNTVNFLLFSILTTMIAQRSGLAAEDEAVWKETEENGFR
jgi:hypothetical protein